MNSIERDAQEFGRHVRQGGWRLGLLVARNVEKGERGGDTTSISRSRNAKVPALAFAEQANVGIPKGTKTKPNRDRISVDRVLAYLTGWENAAEATHVPHAADLSPDEEPSIDWDVLPDWSEFYPPVDGGYNGSKDRAPTAKQAANVLAQLPPEEAATVIAAALDTPEVIAAVKNDDDAVDHVFHVTAALAGDRKPSKPGKKNRALAEMTVVFSLIGVLGEIRDLAKDDSDSPLIKECKGLLRETLEFLDRIEEADDPDAVERMLSDFGDFLAAQ